MELAGGRDQREVDADVIATQALRHRLVPDDLVEVVRFLTSEGAGGLTGQVIEVGAGLVYR